MSADIDEFASEPEAGELVHWMEPRPLSLGLGGAAAATLGAFALGVVVTLGVVDLLRRLRDA